MEDIPFTLCSLLLCNDNTCERAMAAQSPLRGASPRPEGKRLSDLLPDQGVAVSRLFY